MSFRLRNKLSRCAARPTFFPDSPGIAVQGMCPTAKASVLSSTPSCTMAEMPSRGIAILPITTWGDADLGDTDLGDAVGGCRSVEATGGEGAKCLAARARSNARFSYT